MRCISRLYRMLSIAILLIFFGFYTPLLWRHLQKASCTRDLNSILVTSHPRATPPSDNLGRDTSLVVTASQLSSCDQLGESNPGALMVKEGTRQSKIWDVPPRRYRLSHAVTYSRGAELQLIYISVLHTYI